MLDPAVVAGPVSEEVVDPAFAHHPIVVGQRVAGGLQRQLLVPVHTLHHVRHAVAVLDVEAGDALAVLPGQTAGGRCVRYEAVAAGMEHDDVGDGKRALGHLAHAVADLHVLPVSRGGAPRLLLGIDRVDLGQIFVAIHCGLQLGVLAFLFCGLAV
ncbi:hypothetical protein D3C78_789850 [compost metagenome]